MLTFKSVLLLSTTLLMLGCGKSEKYQLFFYDLSESAGNSSGNFGQYGNYSKLARRDYIKPVEQVKEYTFDGNSFNNVELIGNRKTSAEAAKKNIAKKLTVNKDAKGTPMDIPFSISSKFIDEHVDMKELTITILSDFENETVPEDSKNKGLLNLNQDSIDNFIEKIKGIKHKTKVTLVFPAVSKSKLESVQSSFSKAPNFFAYDVSSLVDDASIKQVFKSIKEGSK